jgi:ribosomal protein S18 acetylase RimI-like enzyme
MTIRKFMPNDFEEVLELIAQAFYPTDLYAFVAEEKGLRQRFLSDIFRYRVALGVAYGQADVVEENGRLLGAAIWTPPITYKDSYLAAQKKLDELGPMSRAVESFPDQVKDRWLNFFDLFLSARDTVVKQPYWSLTPIAVIPDRQGQKVGSSLLRKKFAEIDQENLPCFLGTQDNLGRDIYLHYGFDIGRRDLVKGSEIFSYSMVRPSADGLVKSLIMDRDLGR